jgi:hypothetical protein
MYTVVARPWTQHYLGHAFGPGEFASRIRGVLDADAGFQAGKSDRPDRTQQRDNGTANSAGYTPASLQSSRGSGQMLMIFDPRDQK